MKKYVFITGPQGSGKTRLADILHRSNPNAVVFDGVITAAEIKEATAQATAARSFCIVTSQLPVTAFPKQLLSGFDVFKLQCM